VKDLEIYQQVIIYIFPIITNLGLIHPTVIFVRLRRFEQRFKHVVKQRQVRRSGPVQSQLRLRESVVDVVHDVDSEKGGADHLRLPPVTTEASGSSSSGALDGIPPQPGPNQQRALWIPSPIEQAKGSWRVTTVLTLRLTGSRWNNARSRFRAF
jgi:hypothetical protein